MSTTQDTATTGFSYRLSRTLGVPPARVWQAWTTPGEYAQWAHAVPGSVEMDVRAGGKWRATMLTPEGRGVPMTGSYLEVVPHRRLVIGMDVPGRPQPAVMHVDLREAAADRTEIVLSRTCETAQERDLGEQTGRILLDGLSAFLGGGKRE